MQTINNDILGMDLLINPKKKTGSETMSVMSGSSLNSGSGGNRRRTKKVVKSGSFDDSASETSSIADVKSIRSSSSKERKAGTARFGQGRPIPDDDTESILSDTTSESGSGISSLSSAPQKRMSQEEIMNTKRELLYQFDRLERKGMKIPKKFTLASSLEEMKLEYERIKTDRDVESSVRFQRSMLQTFVSGVEFLNSKFNPVDLKLDGWSESINENITDYDDIFEELYHKYRGKAKMPPEMRLMFSVGGSAVMFHITNTMFKSSLPGLDQVMKQNPDLMKQFAAATMKTMDSNTQQATGPAGGGFGLGGIMSSLFGFGGSPQPMQHAPPMQHEPMASNSRSQMRGPSNMDDIMRELNASSMNDVEVMSTVTDSELSEIPEDASVSGIFPASKPRRGGKGGGARGGNRKVLNI